MQNFQNVIHRVADNSYIIDKNEMPYHVTQEEDAGLWAEVDNFAKSYPAKVATEYPAPAPTLEEVKSAAFERLRQRKWQAKNAGITVQGIAIATDQTGQETISGAVLNVLIDPAFTANWKTEATNPDGSAVWVTVGREVILAMAAALTAHTEACFAVEAEKQAGLAALSSVEAVNAWLESELDTGWPGVDL